MNQVLRYTAVSVGLTLKTVLEPTITLPVLLAILYAPPSVKQELRKSASPELIAKVASVLKTLVGLGIFKKVNTALGRLTLNNWTTDTWEWQSREIVLVTGGSSGIGAVVVDKLADLGVKVAIIDIAEPIKRYPNVSFHKCDITKPTEVYEAAAEIKHVHGGPVTVLVNNAGIGHPRLILDIEDELLRKTFDVNITSHWTTCKAFLPDMIAANHGHVLEIASMASFVSVAGMTHYCSTKSAVLSFTEGLQQELRHHYKAPKVRVSSIHPSWTTSLLTNSFEDHLTSRGVKVMTTDYVAGIIVDHILKGQGGQVCIPPQFKSTTYLRSWPWWFSETVRNSTKKTIDIAWKGAAVA